MTTASLHEKKIVIKRAYEARSPDDGYRVLVDRVWPRGRSREALELDEYAPELAPSIELRKWFHHDPQHWVEFRLRYELELSAVRVQIRASQLLSAAGGRQVTLVYGARDPEHNHAIVLRDFLVRLQR